MGVGAATLARLVRIDFSKEGPFQLSQNDEKVLATQRSGEKKCSKQRNEQVWILINYFTNTYVSLK